MQQWYSCESTSDSTSGLKEYTCVVVRTAETANLKYHDDLYEPRQGCDYKILFEVPMDRLKSLYRKSGVGNIGIVGWVESPLKEAILEYWKGNIDV